MNSEKIFVAGHKGMLGSAILRYLNKIGHKNILTATKESLDLTKQSDVNYFFEKNKPDLVFMAAAKVGGIHANNTFPAEFIYNNIVIQANVIHGSYKAKVKKLLFLGSSCIYPRDSIQPMRESSLLSGQLESTNEPYAIAKISGIKLCESYNRQFDTDFRCLMPTNLYGPGDNYHPTNSHVLPGLIRRLHAAKNQNLKIFELWGSGTPKREFLFVDDLADACIHFMNLDRKVISECTSPMMSHVNVGSGDEITILDLAYTIAKIVGFNGEITPNNNNLDGPIRKLLDCTLIKRLGWSPKTSLNEGIELAYSDFLSKVK